MTIRLSHRNLPECQGKVYAGVNLGLAQPRQAFIDTRQGVGILNGHLVQRADVAAEAQLPVFLPLQCHSPKGTARAVSSPGQEVPHLLIGTFSFFRGHPTSTFAMRYSPWLYLYGVFGDSAPADVRLVLHE